jgi:hypothetical protein
VLCRAFADSALAAALDPIYNLLSLPDEKYAAWRCLTIAFKPTIARFN